MADEFTCRECGRTTYSENYEWRDETLYRNLKKLKLCEECYRNGRDTPPKQENPLHTAKEKRKKQETPLHTKHEKT